MATKTQEKNKIPFAQQLAERVKPYMVELTTDMTNGALRFFDNYINNLNAKLDKLDVNVLDSIDEGIYEVLSMMTDLDKDVRDSIEKREKERQEEKDAEEERKEKEKEEDKEEKKEEQDIDKEIEESKEEDRKEKENEGKYKKALDAKLQRHTKKLDKIEKKVSQSRLISFLKSALFIALGVWLIKALWKVVGNLFWNELNTHFHFEEKLSALWDKFSYKFPKFAANIERIWDAVKGIWDEIPTIIGVWEAVKELAVKVSNLWHYFNPRTTEEWHDALEKEGYGSDMEYDEPIVEYVQQKYGYRKSDSKNFVAALKGDYTKGRVPTSTLSSKFTDWTPASAVAAEPVTSNISTSVEKNETNVVDASTTVNSYSSQGPLSDVPAYGTGYSGGGYYYVNTTNTNTIYNVKAEDTQ